MDSITQACRLHQRATRDFAAGRLAAAEAACRQALRKMRRGVGLRHPDSVNIANTLGAILEGAGRYQEAARIFQESVRNSPRAAEREVGLIRVQSLASLGNLLRAAGKYPEAGRTLRRALALATASFGKTHQQTAACRNDLAVLYKYTGRFDEAMRLYRLALRTSRRSGDAQQTATIYHNIGGLEHARGRFAAGEAPARKALALRRAELGSRHPAVAADAAALAGILDGLGRCAESRKLYALALGVFRRCYGPVHYEIAVNLNNLACVESDCGHHAQAEALFRETLTMKEKLLGKPHPDTALTAHNLATCLRDQGRRREAQSYAKRALAVFQRCFQEGHPKVLAARNLLRALELGAS